MSEEEPPPLEPAKIFDALDRYEVQYVLVGGVAAQAHGATRVTKDLDLCPAWDARNLELLAGALRELGARYKSVADHLRLPPDARLIAGQEIGAWRTEAGDIDVLNNIPRQRAPRRVARYAQLLADAAVFEIDGRQIPVASLKDLIRSKEIVDRPKDRAALAELRQLLERAQAHELGREADPGGFGFEP